MFFLLQSGIIPLSFLPTSGLFCKDATQIPVNIIEWLELVQTLPHKSYILKCIGNSQYRGGHNLTNTIHSEDLLKRRISVKILYDNTICLLNVL